MQMSDETRLGRMTPFRRLAPAQLRRVLGFATTGRHSAGAFVFDEGQPVERFHLLLSGHIRLVRMTVDGDQIILLHIPEGQMFGTGIALGQLIHQTCAVAADTCVVLSWPNALWPDFSTRYEGLAAETYRACGARADEMSNRIVELSTKLVEQRIACALLRMISQSGRKVAGGIEIGFPLTRQNIADMTGTTLHTVSRVLSAWEKQGMLQSLRRHIVVKTPHRMVMMAGGGAAGLAEALLPKTLVLPDYASAADTAACNSRRNPASSRPYSRQASTTV